MDRTQIILYYGMMRFKLRRTVFVLCVLIGLSVLAQLFVFDLFGSKGDRTKVKRQDQKFTSRLVQSVDQRSTPSSQTEIQSPISHTNQLNDRIFKNIPIKESTHHRSGIQDPGVERVLQNVETCLEATNMVETADKSTALSNAEYFYHQYRKLIPTDFLKNYSSHCWNMHYDVTLRNRVVYQGHIGKYNHNGGIIVGPRTLMNPLLTLQNELKGKFSSEIVCLPKVFQIGFPKCGSTYAWCFLQSLVRLSTNLGMSSQIEVDKEPHFWVRIRVTQAIKMPKPTDLAEYLLNFLPGLSKVNTLKKQDVVFMDGTPNMMFDWPRFAPEQPNSSNYCLIPSVFPELLPKSKYIVIMRNPVKMLYSAFWFSCVTKGITVPYETQLKGPSYFHDRVKAKIDLFNDCMRDSRVPEIKDPCPLAGDADYGSCIVERLHLLDQCVRKITFNLFTEEMPKCGRSRVEMGLYYTHIRKWLSVIPRENMFFLTLEKLIREPSTVARQLLEFLEFPQSEAILEKVKRITLTCSENNQNTIDYKHNPKLKMREDTKAMLIKFFQPFNVLLSELLHVQDRDFLWTN